VFERAMAREPAQRFYQAGAMREALQVPAPRPAPVRPPTLVMPAPPIAGTSAYVPVDSEPARVSRALWAAAIGAVLLLVIMLMALGAPFSTPPPSPVGTTTPAPPPPTSIAETSTIASTPELAPPPPVVPPGKPGKKPKGGKGN
jgi:serine/threonine-protein kinase